MLGFADQPKAKNETQLASQVAAPSEREDRKVPGSRVAALLDVEALQRSLSESEPVATSVARLHGVMPTPETHKESISNNASSPSVFARAQRVATVGLFTFEGVLGWQPSEQWTPRASLSLLGDALRLHEGPRAVLLPILAILFLMLVVIALVAAGDSGVEQQKPLMPRGLLAVQSAPAVSSKAWPSGSIVQQSCAPLPLPSMQRPYQQQQSLGVPRQSSCATSLAPASSLPQLLFTPKQPPVGPDMALRSPSSILPKVSLETLSHGPAPPQPGMLCPALVMPHCETWLALSVERLLAGEGVAQVFGVSGTPLLQVTMRSAQGSHIIDFAMAATRSPTLGSMVAGPIPGALELRGPDGHSLGELRCCGSGVHALTMGGREAFTVVQDAQGRTLLYAPSGQRPCAEACQERRSDILAGAEVLTVRVDPGKDAVLSLACVVSVLLYDSRASIASSAGSSPVAPARASTAKD